MLLSLATTRFISSLRAGTRPILLIAASAAPNIGVWHIAKLNKYSLTDGLNCSLYNWSLLAAQINQSLKEIVDLILKENTQSIHRSQGEIYLNLPFMSLSTYYNALIR